MLKRMGQRYTGTYIGYILTVSIGIFTVVFELQLFIVSSAGNEGLRSARSLSAVWSVVGYLLAGLLMTWGRRRVLLALAPLICGFAILSLYADSFWLVLALKASEEILSSFLFVATMLYTKETTSFAHSGVPLGCFMLWRELGYATGSLLNYLCGTVYNIRLGSHEYLYLRLVLHLVALIPIVCQGLLLLLYFKYDSPAYLVAINQDEEALSMLHLLYGSADIATACFERMKEIADRNKFSRVTWKKLVTPVYLFDIFGCFLLLFFRATSGITNGNIYGDLFQDHIAALRDLFYNCGSFLCVLLSLLYIDRFSVSVLLRFGYLWAMVLNLVNLAFGTIYTTTHKLLLLSATVADISSYPHYLLVVIATYKFVAGLLNDKGIACAVLGLTLADVILDSPNGFFEPPMPDFLRLGMHTISLLLSIAAYFFATWFVNKHSSILEHTQDRLIAQ